MTPPHVVMTGPGPRRRCGPLPCGCGPACRSARAPGPRLRKPDAIFPADAAAAATRRPRLHRRAGGNRAGHRRLAATGGPAPRLPPAPGAGRAGDAHRAGDRRTVARLRPAAAARHRRHRRGRRAQGRTARHRHPRRHGCAAGGRTDRPAPCLHRHRLTTAATPSGCCMPAATTCTWRSCPAWRWRGGAHPAGRGDARVPAGRGRPGRSRRQLRHQAHARRGV